MFRRHVYKVLYRNVLLISAMGMMLVFFGCPATVGTCTNDTDCTGADQICKEGRCQAKGSEGCTYEGKSYKEGATFPAKDGCNTCECKDGNAICTKKGCITTCEYEGKTYQDGETFRGKNCEDCTCKDGKTNCTPKDCPPPTDECTGTCKDQKQYCHYDAKDACGETSTKGTCKDKPTTCDDIDKPVCGCDDKTYANACTAHMAGVSIQKEGACASTSNQCGGSVVCPDLKKQYCHYDVKDACGETSTQGTCKDKPTTCDDIDKPVCGCDDKTYDNACSAHMAGVSIQKEGACASTSNQCGGSVVCPDLKKQYCHYEPADACGKTNPMGKCKDKPSGCTGEVKPVCGCDGKTYSNACNAHGAGVSVQKEGSCEAGPTTCGGNVKCTKPDEYCHFETTQSCGGNKAQGTCRKKPTNCTKEKKPVCGCDGQTYDNSCLAHTAGVSIKQEGACCQTGPKICGGYFAIKCKGTNEYCHLQPKDLCGAADATGICKTKPAQCTTQKEPVCGCDGNDYGNPCEANMAGISVSYGGQCARPPGSCLFQFTSYDDGTSFPYDCNQCTCKSGQVSCTKKACPPRACGTQNDPPCPGGYFCDRPSHCGSSGAAGTCKKIRTTPCLGVPANTVCGCDQTTYRSACEADIAGVSVKAQGACKCDP